MSPYSKILGIVVMSASACTVGPNYERPAVPEHDGYRTDVVPADSGVALGADSIADLAWWELFQDTVLQDLIDTALANNQELDVALARIAEARANLGVSRADLYPEINAIGNAGLRADTDNDLSGSGLIAADVFWQVDLWGRIRRSNEAAFNELLATEEAYRAVTISLVADVASFYLLLRDLDNRQLIAEQTAQTRLETLDIIRARFDAGAVSEVDLNQAEIQLYEARASVEVFRRGRAQTEHAISVLIGVPPMVIPRGEGLAQQVFPPELPVGLPSALVERRPDVLEAERRLHAQTARIGVAEALKYPSLTLGAGAGVSFGSATVGFLDAAADLFAPIFNAGRNQNRVDAEIARTEQALARYEQTILTAFREVEDAMVAIRTYETEHENRLLQLQAARSASDLSWIRYEGGLTSYLEYLDLQRALFAAELQASETLQLRLASLVELYKALGGGWNPAAEADEASPEP
jgi:multidrug efflux system outer membrane protein